MFEETQCKHPVIVLKDIGSEELESLLSYMYVGEVNVVQEKLSGLIKAAECLRIKGLAVPDEESNPSKISFSSSREKRTIDNSISSDPKRRRQDDSRQSNVNKGDEKRKSIDSNKLKNSNNVRSNNRGESSSESVQSARETQLLSSPSSNNIQALAEVKMEEPNEPPEPYPPAEVVSLCYLCCCELGIVSS